MKWFLIFFILIGTHSAWAQLSIRAPYRHLSFDYQMWQQELEATSLSNPVFFRMRFQGLQLSYRWAKPQKNFRWVTLQGVSVGFGQVKGATLTNSDDQVKNQPWLSASFEYGWLYRTSARSELSLTLPITIRQNQWQVKSGLEFKDKTTASIGASAGLITRFNPFQSIHLTLTQHHQWQTTLWNLGYRQDLR